MEVIQKMFSGIGKMQTMAFIAFVLAILFSFATVTGIVQITSLKKVLPADVFERLLTARYSEIKELFLYVIMFYFGRNLGRTEQKTTADEN